MWLCKRKPDARSRAVGRLVEASNRRRPSLGMAMSKNGTSLNGHTRSSTVLSCPLCAGTGSIERREILRLAGMDGVVEAVGPCVTEWLNDTGGKFLDKV